jgi:Protein of unknown function (DUF1559)
LVERRKLTVPVTSNGRSSGGWLLDDELTLDWLREVQPYCTECDAADRQRLESPPDREETVLTSSGASSGDIAAMHEAAHRVRSWKDADPSVRSCRPPLLLFVLSGCLWAALVTDLRATTFRDVWRWKLRDITWALHEYWNKHGHLPEDIQDKQGRPLLSWRVRLLPYLRDSEGLEGLYEQFHLDEACADAPRVQLSTL